MKSDIADPGTNGKQINFSHVIQAGQRESIDKLERYTPVFRKILLSDAVILLHKLSLLSFGID